MIQVLPQYMILLKARLNKPHYHRIPTEDTTEETIIFDQERTHSMNDQVKPLFQKKIRTPAPNEEALDNLYQRIIFHKEREKRKDKTQQNKPKFDFERLYERIEKQKEAERIKHEEQKSQERIKQHADEYTKIEIMKIEHMLEQIRQTPVIENTIDARTSPPQSHKNRLPSRKEIGQFTQRILKPVIQNLSREIITK